MLLSSASHDPKQVPELHSLEWEYDQLGMGMGLDCIDKRNKNLVLIIIETGSLEMDWLPR